MAKKAIAAAVFAFIGALGTALLDGQLSTVEALSSLGTGLVAAAAIGTVRPDPPQMGPGEFH